MIYDIKISNEANLDLKSIYEYIAFSLLSPETAMKQLDRLETGILSLRQFSKRFKLYRNMLWHNLELRIKPIDNFLVFYVSDDETQLVTILRVLYQGRNIPNLLSDSLPD